MRLRSYRPEDLATITALYNQFWAGVPRAAPITAEDFECRVIAMPTFEDTTLLVVEGDPSAGFVHFGPREEWDWDPQERAGPDRSVGLIHALCAGDDSVRAALLRAAETALREAGAQNVWLWPTWARGTLCFYNGLTPSNEVSGQWSESPLVAWAERQGYSSGANCRIGVLAPLEGREYPPVPAEAEAVAVPFATPLIPEARRLSLRQKESGEEIGYVIYCGAEERNRALGTRECAAFDVAVAAPHRGQGWGRALMGEMARQAIREGYTAMQLLVKVGNTPAENLYFRSIGFVPEPESHFLSLHKQCG